MDTVGYFVAVECARWPAAMVLLVENNGRAAVVVLVVAHTVVVVRHLLVVVAEKSAVDPIVDIGVMHLVVVTAAAV